MIEQHRALYGRLDPFAVAPFLAPGGYLKEPLSHEGDRLASLLNRAIRGRLPVTADIREELVRFLSAGFHGRRYDRALRRQKLIALLERYGRRIGGRRRSEEARHE